MKCFGLAAMALLSLAMPASAEVHPGFGSDERRPTGATFNFPAGVEIAGPIVGADDDGNCPKPRTRAVGSGLSVRACVPIRNRTGGPVQVTFPPGLVIVSASEGFQNGLLVERTVLTIPPTSGGPGKLRDKEEDIVYVPLHFYCINKPKAPSDSTAFYKMGPVVSHSGLAALYALMKTRNVYEDGQKVEAVQEIIYDIIKNGKLSDYNLQSIREDIDGIGREVPSEEPTVT